jgi:hypothetical protein
MKRHLRRAAWVCVVLILLGVIVWTGANLVGSMRYQSAVEALKAEGFVLQPSRMAPDPVAVAENGAPFYSAAFALFVEPEEAPWADEGKKLLDLKPEDRASVVAWLERNRDAFDMLRRAQKRPRCRFERDYSLGYTMPLPELSKAMGLSRALSRLAETRLPAGDVAGAREAVSLLFSLGECLREDPILVSYLVRAVLLERALTAVQDAVTEATGEVELRAWQALLPAESPLKGGLERAFRGEIAMAAALIDTPDSETWAPLTGMNSGSAVAWDLLRPLVRYDGADYLYDMRTVILACRKSYLEGAADIASVRLQDLHPLRSPIRRQLLPALGTSLKRQAAVEARLLVVRAGLEAERTLKASGAYPQSISGVDPFSGKPLIYDLDKGRIAGTRPTEGPEDQPTEWRLRAKK